MNGQILDCCRRNKSGMDEAEDEEENVDAAGTKMLEKSTAPGMIPGRFYSSMK